MCVCVFVDLLLYLERWQMIVRMVQCVCMLLKVLVIVCNHKALLRSHLARPPWQYLHFADAPNQATVQGNFSGMRVELSTYCGGSGN